jgi:HSP20 family protein
MWEDKMWQKMRKMQRKMDRLFGNIGTVGFGKKFEDEDGELGKYRKAWTDFRENEEEFLVYVEIPGVDKEDIKLDINNEAIEIKAEKRQVKNKEDIEKGEYSYSKSYTGFARRIEMPEDADLSKIDAEYKNGVLRIVIGKKKIKVDKRGREIKIK